MEASVKHNGTIDSYIERYPEDVRIILEKIRKTIKDIVPEAEEAISYGIPTYRLKGNLVHFAAFRNHIGFYPSPSGIAAFEKELADYKTSKGAVQFPLDRPIPFALIRKIVRFRVKENMGRAKR
ncbi:MAG: DUF1801 domain-containing protein [Thermoplasmata archaeon]|nr:DUF1801 domain-containing protein [Thermoplasmata archaeon]